VALDRRQTANRSTVAASRTFKVVLFVMFTKQALPCRSRPPVQCKECTSTAGRGDMADRADPPDETLSPEFS